VRIQLSSTSMMCQSCHAIELRSGAGRQRIWASVSGSTFRSIMGRRNSSPDQTDSA
jgi:hypothetical protein